MSRSDVPWVAAVITIFGILWASVLASTYKETGFSAMLVVAMFPVVCFVIWYVVKTLLLKFLFPAN